MNNGSGSIKNSAPDIPCEVCRDLMPLVQDGVASEASRRLVERHVARCEACRELWRQADTLPPAGPDDQKVLPRIRRRLRLWMFGVMAVGLLLGMALMFSSWGANYNVLLMPALGALLWFFGGRRRRLLPLGVGALYGVAYWICCFSLHSPYRGYWALPTWQDALFAVCLALVYLAGCYLGMLAAALLQYAFTKEEPDHDIGEEV